tara:strand:- start:283 stop:1206 length:924 start_codon:yes stop_codon:yes gene_type:complete
MANIKLKISVDYLHRNHQCVEWIGFLEYGPYGLRADYLKVINADGGMYVIHDNSRSMRPQGFSKCLIGRNQDSYKGALSMMSLNCNNSGIHWVNPIKSFDSEVVNFEDMSDTLDKIANEICLEGVSLDEFGQCRIVAADEDMRVKLSGLMKQSFQCPCIDTRSIAIGLGKHFGEIHAAEGIKEVNREKMDLYHENLDLKSRIRRLNRNLSPSEPVKFRPRPSDDLRRVYIMKDSHSGLYKIGKSVNPNHRERTLQSEKPSITMVFQCDETKDFNEKALHREYASQRKRGEWFDLSPAQVRFIISQSR